MRVLAINDVSCVGRCSLTVTLPILSACGIECDVLPTAILSTHTGGFKNYTFRDLTEDIPAILKHWKELGLQFDCIFSGYLGSKEQIQMVADLKREFLKKDGLFIVDPVMGDSGELYAGFSPDYVEKMKWLCSLADYILPNATEGCYLANAPYPIGKQAYPIEWVLKGLQTLCPRPIVTGVQENGRITVRFLDENGNAQIYEQENVPGFYCGAGDVFASAFIGAVLKGKTEFEAIRLAADFTTSAIRRSAIEVQDKRFGLNFEPEIYPFLKALNE
ncbi:MAG: pyridoxamine kinase [Clostridia bacterium]|nr:pyridoxamine kinase [Clostridia bacterium]